MTDFALETTTTALNKDAYLSLTAANNAHFEDTIDEYVTILAEDDEEDLEAMRGVLTATLTHLAVQRKLDSFLVDNVPAQTKESVDYSLEVAERLGISGFSVRPVIVADPKSVDYKALLDLIVGN